MTWLLFNFFVINLQISIYIYLKTEWNILKKMQLYVVDGKGLGAELAYTLIYVN